MAATLRDVVDHYDNVFKFGMTEEEKVDLTAFMAAL